MFTQPSLVPLESNWSRNPGEIAHQFAKLSYRKTASPQILSVMPEIDPLGPTDVNTTSSPIQQALPLMPLVKQGLFVEAFLYGGLDLLV